MKKVTINPKDVENESTSQIDIDLTSAEAARKAFIASEIFNRKY